MFTLKDLKEKPPGMVFMDGTFINSREDIYVTSNVAWEDSTLYWAAKKGSGYDDWAIYVSPNSNLDYIISYGDKLYGDENIKKLTDCDDEVLAKYRK